MKKKRKFKNGDIRLTQKGHILFGTLIAAIFHLLGFTLSIFLPPEFFIGFLCYFLANATIYFACILSYDIESKFTYYNESKNKKFIFDSSWEYIALFFSFVPSWFIWIGLDFIKYVKENAFEVVGDDKV